MTAYIINPNGTVTTFNLANRIHWESGKGFYAALYAKSIAEGGVDRFVCTVPDGAIVSFDRPCDVMAHAITSAQTLSNMADVLAHAADKIGSDWGDRQRLAALKKKLKSYNANSGTWKRGRK